MSAPSGDDDPIGLRRERDLYLQLLELGQHTSPSSFLQGALDLVVELVGAREGYLELHDSECGSDAPRWWSAHGLSPDRIEGLRAGISRGIIAEALATGRTVVTASALLDPRFGARASVKRAAIDAVLCAPIGANGALYLQGREPVVGPFTEADRLRVELVARHLGPHVDRVVLQHRHREGDDPTRPVRTLLRCDGLVGRSPALARALRDVAMVAPSSKTVLITGDTGTGKTQLARVIHDSGPRASRPFVEVNCSNLSETLADSELFGAIPGAHSTATRRIEGKVEAAQRGTLFLDDVGDLPLPVQAKLLQFLQSKQFYPLGSSKPVHADVRLIAGTNVDLEAAVTDGRFRRDLLYRLDVITVRMPTLAERPDDIAELATFFCREGCRSEGLAPLELSPDAVRALESVPWPGNVRQLQHRVEQGLLRAASEGATQVERRHLFSDAPARSTDASDDTFQEATRKFQAQLLLRALKDSGWDVVATARRLDMSRAHLYTLIRAHGIAREPGQRRSGRGS